jgi:hypothetical protein
MWTANEMTKADNITRWERLINVLSFLLQQLSYKERGHCQASFFY